VSKPTPLPSDRVFETSSIRLSADETRLIIRVANSHNKPVCDYRSSGLVEMGILKETESPPPDTTSEKAALWKAIKAAAAEENSSKIHSNLLKLSELAKPKASKILTLTPLGKEIARGITVKLNGQYATSKC
jgi:hypothetical protein